MKRLSRASKNGSKGDWHGDHWNYVKELAWEKILGVPSDHYVTKPMEIGAAYEGEARVELWQRYGPEIEQTGFILHPTLPYLGSSPDGYLMENGIVIPVEIKVPQVKTHEQYLEDGVVPEIYVPQLLTEMLCCDRAPYGYFASYCPPDICPEMPDELRMFRVRLDADPEKFAEIEEAATATMEHVAEKMAKIRAMYPAGAKIERQSVPEQQWPADLTSPEYDFVDGNVGLVP